MIISATNVARKPYVMLEWDGSDVQEVADLINETYAGLNVQGTAGLINNNGVPYSQFADEEHGVFIIVYDSSVERFVLTENGPVLWPLTYVNQWYDTVSP